jgi:hypothetical protein
MAGIQGRQLMSINTTAPEALTSRAPDDRFRSVQSANDKWATIRKIDLNSMQLDDSFENNSDPYNSTGRFLATALKNRNRD